MCWMSPLLGARQEGWGNPRVLSPPWDSPCRLAGGGRGDPKPATAVFVSAE